MQQSTPHHIRLVVSLFSGHRSSIRSPSYPPLSGSSLVLTPPCPPSLSPVMYCGLDLDGSNVQHVWRKRQKGGEFVLNVVLFNVPLRSRNVSDGSISTVSLVNVGRL